MIDIIKSNPKTILLVDSIGALISTIMLGLVLTTFEPVFGMPRAVLFLLAAIALTFCIYSFLSYRLSGENWRPFLIGISAANLIYCFLTLGLVIYLFEELTTVGMLYFASEMAVIVILATLELKIALKPEPPRT